MKIAYESLIISCLHFLYFFSLYLDVIRKKCLMGSKMESRLKIIGVVALLFLNYHHSCYAFGWFKSSQDSQTSVEDQVPSISIPWAYSDMNPNRYANLIKDMIKDANVQGQGQVVGLLLQMQDILRDRSNAAKFAQQGLPYQKKSFFNSQISLGMKVFPGPRGDTVIKNLENEINELGQKLRGLYLANKQNPGGFFQSMINKQSASFSEIINNLDTEYQEIEPIDDSGFNDEEEDDESGDIFSDGGQTSLQAQEFSESNSGTPSVASASTPSRNSTNQVLSQNLYLKQFAQKYGLVSYDDAFNGQIIRILSTANIGTLEKAASIFDRYNLNGLKLSQKSDKALFISGVSFFVERFDTVCANTPEICTRAEIEPFESVFMPKLLNVLKRQGTF